MAIGFSNGTLKICEFKIPEDPSGSSQGLGGTKHWIVELFNTRESREAVTHVSCLLNSHFLTLNSCLVRLRRIRNNLHKNAFASFVQCTFSEDSAHLAVAYADNIVCLFR